MRDDLTLGARLEAFCLVDRNNKLQGLDDYSGGYPYRALTLGHVRYWGSEDVAVRYCKTLNQSESSPGRPYRVVPVRLVPTEQIDMLENLRDCL